MHCVVQVENWAIQPGPGTTTAPPGQMPRLALLYIMAANGQENLCIQARDGWLTLELARNATTDQGHFAQWASRFRARIGRSLELAEERDGESANVAQVTGRMRITPAPQARTPGTSGVAWARGPLRRVDCRSSLRHIGPGRGIRSCRSHRACASRATDRCWPRRRRRTAP